MKVATFTAAPSTISTIIVLPVHWQIWFEVTPVSLEQSELAVNVKDRIAVLRALSLFDQNAMTGEREK